MLASYVLPKSAVVYLILKRLIEKAQCHWENKFGYKSQNNSSGRYLRSLFPIMAVIVQSVLEYNITNKRKRGTMKKGVILYADT
jgi:hypothetical protein